MEFRPGDEVTLSHAPFNSPNIERRVLITGYSNFQPENERNYLIVGIGAPLIGSNGFPVNAPASDLSP